MPGAIVAGECGTGASPVVVGVVGNHQQRGWGSSEDGGLPPYRQKVENQDIHACESGTYSDTCSLRCLDGLSACLLTFLKERGPCGRGKNIKRRTESSNCFNKPEEVTFEGNHCPLQEGVTMIPVTSSYSLRSLAFSS